MMKTVNKKTIKLKLLRHGSSQMITARGMDKDDVGHIYKTNLLTCKKMKYALCSKMDEPRDYHPK